MCGYVRGIGLNEVDEKSLAMKCPCLRSIQMPQRSNWTLLRAKLPHTILCVHQEEK